MLINSISDFRKALRAGKYIWPGGYPQYFILADGEALSFEAAREEKRSILEALAGKGEAGWKVVSVEVNWEDDDLWCCHFGDYIHPAFPKD